MKLLIVKTSSFGDILHALPALNDAWHCVEGLVCDWLVEAPYAPIPAWHPAVREVLTVSLRGWRRPPWFQHIPAIKRSVRQLRREHYDLVLDAQGLMKSAVLARLARGRRAGFGPRSVGEAPAAHLYQDTVETTAGAHAIDRNRTLFAAALGYTVPAGLNYGLRIPAGVSSAEAEPFLVFVPGTTWPSKRWPERYWRELAVTATTAGWPIRLLSGNDAERAAVQRIGADLDGVEIRASPTLDELARLLRGAVATVSVDSGPGHLAAALGTPGVSIYGATDAALTGTRGRDQVHLCADFECAPCLARRCRFADRGQVHPNCYATVPAVRVWSTLHELISSR